jgi:hypothetical protein
VKAAVKRRAPRSPRIRTGQGDAHIPRAEFERRYREQFFDPAFRPLEAQIAKLVDVAWTVIRTPARVR